MLDDSKIVAGEATYGKAISMFASRCRHHLVGLWKDPINDSAESCLEFRVVQSQGNVHSLSLLQWKLPLLLISDTPVIESVNDLISSLGHHCTLVVKTVHILDFHSSNLTPRRTLIVRLFLSILSSESLTATIFMVSLT